MTKSSRELRPETLAEFLPTVRYWARHYTHHANQVLDFDDLVVVGLIGLMDAVKRYQQEAQSHFKTYAEFRIRGEIVDELRRQDWMTRSERRKQKSYRSAEGQLEQKLGRDPTREELAKVLPFKSCDLDRMAQYGKREVLCPYLEGDYNSAEGLHDTVAEVVTIHDEVRSLLEQLPPAMRTILEMRYYDEAPIHEIAQAVGLSQGRVSQLHAEAMELLRAKKVA